jgi:exosortase
VRVQSHRRAAATIGVGGGLGALVVWLYASTLLGLGSEWLSSPDSSYGLVLAVIAALTFWNRRRLIVASAVQPSGLLPGLVLLAGGLMAFLIGRFGADVFVTRVSFVIVAAGLVWTIGGTTTARICAAPLALLFIAVPLPALVVNAVTMPMQLAASHVAEWMLAALHIPVFRDGNVLELQSTSLEVAEACSGLRSLISLTAIGCLVAWATERRVVRRIAVIAAAPPIALAFNAVRIAATGIACETWGPQAAKGGWHTFAGWLTFVVAVAALVRVQRLLPRRTDGQRRLRLQEAA